MGNPGDCGDHGPLLSEGNCTSWGAALRLISLPCQIQPHSQHTARRRAPQQCPAPREWGSLAGLGWLHCCLVPTENSLPLVSAQDVQEPLVHSRAGAPFFPPRVETKARAKGTEARTQRAGPAQSRVQIQPPPWARGTRRKPSNLMPHLESANSNSPPARSWGRKQGGAAERPARAAALGGHSG